MSEAYESIDLGCKQARRVILLPRSRVRFCGVNGLIDKSRAAVTIEEVEVNKDQPPACYVTSWFLDRLFEYYTEALQINVNKLSEDCKTALGRERYLLKRLKSNASTLAATRAEQRQAMNEAENASHGGDHSASDAAIERRKAARAAKASAEFQSRVQSTSANEDLLIKELAELQTNLGERENIANGNLQRLSGMYQKKAAAYLRWADTKHCSVRPIDSFQPLRRYFDANPERLAWHQPKESESE